MSRTISNLKIVPTLHPQAPGVSYNLLGQKLGRKGRDTRERILTATESLLAGDRDNPISLSAVAREASLGMTTLYLYFGDLTELLLAVLDRTMAAAEESYIADLRARWPDEEMSERCLSFVRNFHDFWLRNTRILHLRNSHADAGERRMVEHRIRIAQPLIELFVAQMEKDPSDRGSEAVALATVLFTGIERLVTVTTDVNFANLSIQAPEPHVQKLLRGQAKVLELGVRHGRAMTEHAPW